MRPKHKKNSMLPRNLSCRRINGKDYFRYWDGNAGRYFGMGFDRANAIMAALELNDARLKPSLLAERVTVDSTPKMSELIARFLAEKVEGADISKATKAGWRTSLRKIGEAIGTMRVAQVGVEDCSQMLDKEMTASNRSYQVLRHHGIKLFDYAAQRGLRPINNPNPLRPTEVKEPQKQRLPLLVEDFWPVWDKAPRLLQLAMEISVLSTQGRSEIHLMKWSDYQDDALAVKRQKTGKRVRLIAEKQLQAVFERCRDGVESEYILHYGEDAPRGLVGKPVSPDTLSKWFRKARDACGRWDHVENKEQRPTFHELRGLASHLLLSQGRGEDAQAAMMHGDRKQTDHYAAAHPQPVPTATVGSHGVALRLIK